MKFNPNIPVPEKNGIEPTFLQWCYQETDAAGGNQFACAYFTIWVDWAGPETGGPNTGRAGKTF